MYLSFFTTSSIKKNEILKENFPRSVAFFLKIIIIALRNDSKFVFLTKQLNKT